MFNAVLWQAAQVFLLALLLAPIVIALQRQHPQRLWIVLVSVIAIALRYAAFGLLPIRGSVAFTIVVPLLICLAAFAWSLRKLPRPG